MPDSIAEKRQYDELCAWSLSRRDASFVHQFVVDCWVLRHALADSKPIGVVFPLVSLYLRLEHGFTGRQVQRAHMKLAKQRKEWPRMPLPAQRAKFSLSSILNLENDTARDDAIDHWCATVWENWKEAQPEIRELVHRELGVQRPTHPNQKRD